jgi:NADH:ubiquinone oxidoreductase subunit 5 (subunit L)/multisubunit Na+/H+ antiporter MnhA subunit
VAASGYFVARLAFLFTLSRAVSALAALAVAGALAALGGWALRIVGTPDGGDAEPLGARWLDAAAGSALGASAARGGAFLDEFDRRVVGGFVSAVAIGARALAWVTARADEALLDGASRAASRGVLRSGRRLERLQSGPVRTYVLAIVFGIMALAFLPYWLR